MGILNNEQAYKLLIRRRDFKHLKGPEPFFGKGAVYLKYYVQRKKVYFFSNQVCLRQSKILLENKRSSERDRALDYQEITCGLKIDFLQDTVNSGYTYSK